MSLANDAPTAPPSPARRRMTVAGFLALPDDGVDRMLLDGEVWDIGPQIKDRAHGETAANLCALLGGRAFGRLHAGNVGFRLDGASLVGVDLAVVTPEHVARTPPGEEFFAGPPALAVEILGRFDSPEATAAKIRKFRDAGAVVWEVDPASEIARVHRPGSPVVSYGATEEIVADPYLPGFRAAVAEFFAD